MNDWTDTAPTANGQASLSDRVKELRLTGKMDGAKPATGGTNWLPWLLCFLLAIGWTGYAVKAYRPAAKPDEGPTGPSAAGADKSKSPGDLDQSTPDAVTLEVKGYLIPTQTIKISPIDVAGRVVKLNIQEGMSFKKGDVLAELDPTPIKAMHAESKANLAAARARLAEMEAGSRKEEVAQAMAELEDAKAQLEQYRREWERFEQQKTLSITTKEFETAEANYRSGLKRVEARQKAYDLVKAGPRLERIDAARAEYEAAKARLEQANWKLENCIIKSPVTGVILTKSAEIGSLLNPVVGGVSVSLCDIADLRKLEVDLDVQERDISKVELYQACRVTADAYPTRVYEGYVERVMPIANRAKSIVPVRIKVVPRIDEKQGQYLKPDMSVTVTFVRRVVDKAYRDKVQAILDDDGTASVAPAPKTAVTPKK